MKDQCSSHWMVSALLLCVLVFSALPARAQPVDASPDPSFAGTWRITGAKSVPWAKPHALSREEAPLLAFAIAFREGEVAGAPQLACKQAGYRFIVDVSIKDLFPDKVPAGKDEEMVHAMGLSSSVPGMPRVDCDAGTFHFASESGDLVLVQGDIVYTAVRPEQKVDPGYSGPSFDCTKARTVVEKAICSDEELSKFDRRIAAAYARLGKTETSESFATVQAAQRGWLAFTSKSCGAIERTPRDCLYESYNDRATRLEGAEVLEAGALKLEPRMRYFSRPKPATEESDCYPWMHRRTPIRGIQHLDRRGPWTR